MPEICAGVLAYQLQHVATINNRRSYICQTYESELKNYFGGVFSAAKGVGHIFGVTFDDDQEKKKFAKFLKANQVGYAYHYTSLNKTPKGLDYGLVDCPISDYYASRLIRLPVYFNLSELELEIVIETIKKFYKK